MSRRHRGGGPGSGRKKGVKNTKEYTFKDGRLTKRQRRAAREAKRAANTLARRLKRQGRKGFMGPHIM